MMEARIERLRHALAITAAILQAIANEGRISESAAFTITSGGDGVEGRGAAVFLAVGLGLHPDADAAAEAMVLFLFILGVTLLQYVYSKRFEVAY